MLRRLCLFTILLSLTNCAPVGDSTYNSKATTGFKNEKGIDYVHDDPRVEAAKNEPEPPQPQKPTSKKPEVKTPAQKKLREKLIGFSLLRYNKGATRPSRFGNDHLVLTTYIRQDDGSYKTVKFSSPFNGGHFKLSQDGYTMTGPLQDKAGEKVFGDFEFKNQQGEVARVFYRAYRAKLNVRTSDEQKPDEKSNEIINSLRADTFGWVNNWVVVKGPSYYAVDLVKVSSMPLNNPSVLSFNGPALRTGEDTEPEHEAKTNNEKVQVKLVGDAESQGRRLFEVTMQDETNKDAKDQTQIMVELEEENPEPLPVIPEEPEIENETENPAVIETLDQEPEAETKENEQKQEEEKPEVTARKGGSYFAYEVSSERINKILADYRSSSRSDAVKKYVTIFNTACTKKMKRENCRRQELVQFFKNAYPFRELIETIGNYFNVSAAFAYLTVIESAYFKSDGYPIQRNNTSSATGPFQILDGTAGHLKMRYSKDGAASWDERRYFAPAACGGAKYINELSSNFKGNKDTTLAILAYYQGPGNVNSWINKVKHYAGFNYRFNDLVKFGVLNLDRRSYVQKKLALFTIGENPTAYGFKISGRTTLPKSAFYTGPMKDKACTKAIAPLQPST